MQLFWAFTAIERGIQFEGIRQKNSQMSILDEKKKLTINAGKSKRSASLIKTIAAKPQKVYLKEHDPRTYFIHMHL